MAENSNSVFAELKIGKLPTLPHLLVEMLQVCQSETANFQTISAVISKDAAISARMISLANSSFYSRGTKIPSIERALMVLGTETIKTAVITASVQQFFSSFNTAHTYFLKQFWRHNLVCAMLCRELAQLTSYTLPEEAYLTGLLHNIGELVLDTNYPNEFLQVLVQRDEQAGQANVDYENKVFSTNHCEIGCWLANQWHLSEFAADALNYHHAPLETILDAHHLVKIVYLASKLSDTGAMDDHNCLAAADTLFDLSAGLTREIVQAISDEVENIASTMGIDIESEVETESDKAHRIQLAEHVRNASLLQSANQHLGQATDIKQLCFQLGQSAELLFGFKNTQLFVQEPASNSLVMIRLDEEDKDCLTITTEYERSLVASAALNQRIIFSYDQQLFANQLPIIDQQLIRLTKCSGIVCVPIIHEQKSLAVMVMGTSNPPQNHSGSDYLLSLFATEIGKHIARFIRENKMNSEQDSQLSRIQERLDEIIHEANNPLSIIRNYMHALSSKLKNTQEVDNELNVIKEEIDRTGQILLRLKDIQSEPEESDRKLDINAEIRSLVQLYESSLFLTHDIDCQLTLDERLHQQNNNRNALRQVITNLLKNAAEALVSGGIINIKTSANVNVNGKNFVEIVIQDNGPGIPEQVMRDIFKPVDSTKGTGHSGLGLSITKNLISSLDGSISCRSDATGTSFQILIPDTSDR